MKKHVLQVLLLLVTVSSMAQEEAVCTRLEKTATEFIRVYNTGDTSVYRQFLTRVVEPDRLADLLQRYTNTWLSVGHVEPASLRCVSDRKIEILARETRYDSWWKFTVNTDSQQSFASRTVQPIPLPEAGLGTSAIPVASIAPMLDDYIQHKLGKDFSGNVFVEDKSGILYNRSFGNDQQGRPNSSETVFGLASAGKLFTTVSIFQLVSTGRLALTDSIGALLPQLTNKALSSITIAQLLTHSSGMGDFFEDPKYQQSPPSTDDPATVLSIINAEQLHFPPGQGWAYSNTGFLLLGLVIEKASGQSYGQYVSRHIFEPLHMTRTIAGSGAGGGRSTVSDMRSFLHAFRDSALLDKRSTDLIFSFTINENYGYGTEHYKFGGEHIVGHTGGFINECVELNIYPATGNMVIILSNSNPPFGHFVSNRIKTILLHR